MARKYQSGKRSGYTVLVIDDSPEILESTRLLLESEGHTVLTAPDGETGLAIHGSERIQLILCDYFMPAMTGEEVVRRVREKDRVVQIILVTGYSGEKPARVMMRELDIQGYHDKGEGGERLLLWVDTALKAYRHVLAMEKHRKGLRYILDITPELHRVQPLGDLLQGLLWQIEGLLGAENSFLATLPSEPPLQLPSETEGLEGSEGFVALLEPGRMPSSLEIRYGTGRYDVGSSTEDLPEPERSMIVEALQSGGVAIREGASVVPLRLGNRPLGVIYLDRRTGYDRDRELLEIFASQAAAAIQNSILYDIATTDALTGVYVRAFAVQQLYRTIKQSLRRGASVSLLMIDMDRFKEVNDRYGHQTGDQALRSVGEVLRTAVRETDVVGRYGGDEFMVVLPDTPPAGALIVANRVLQRAEGLSVDFNGTDVPLKLSIGVGALEITPEEIDRMAEPDAVERAGEELLACADRALYAAKGTGHAGEERPLSWTALQPLADA
jgi:diguanylate cyclase (GGDEF)-like protein